MLVKKWFVLLVLLSVIVVSTAARARDLDRSYQRIQDEALSHRDRLQDRVSRLCGDIRSDCVHSSLKSGRHITMVHSVKLYTRKGYRIEPAGRLPAGSGFTLGSPLKGYFRIQLDGGGKFFVEKGVLEPELQGKCREIYERCMAGSMPPAKR